MSNDDIVYYKFTGGSIKKFFESITKYFSNKVKSSSGIDKKSSLYTGIKNKTKDCNSESLTCKISDKNIEEITYFYQIFYQK